MRHKVAQRKLGMKTAHRLATLANLATSLIMHNRIETTLPRAKELKRIADKLITLGKKKTVHSARRARQILRNRDAVTKLFNELALRYTDRKGGYTRVYKLGNRHGDCAEMAIIEYLDAEGASSGKTDDKAKGAKKSKKEPSKTATKKSATAKRDLKAAAAKKETVKDKVMKKLKKKR